MNFSENNKGEWFYFDSSDKEEGVCLRLISEGVERLLREECTIEIKDIIIENKLFQKPIIDEKKYREGYFNYCIVDWKGINIDEKEAPCTKENKIKLIDKSPEFLKFYNKSMDELENRNVFDF